MKFNKETKMLAIVTIIALLITSAAAKSVEVEVVALVVEVEVAAQQEVAPEQEEVAPDYKAEGPLWREGYNYPCWSWSWWCCANIEELLMADSMQEDPQLVPSASPQSPSEEHKHMLGGQGETDESPNLRVVSASKGSKILLLLVVIIGLMVTSAVAKGGRGFGRGGTLGGSRAAGTGGVIGGARATTGGKTSASVAWGPTSTFWLLVMNFIFLMV
ncbi:hypothetical protein POTOM_052170 [Populus tomentosa]|uniref:Uncharacterized protein n=1 Tax=Populus tomentosa TaxID=118781 RepID=A0A8X7Y3P6_POPTO|nr:hypothetical protein POTOM_052170 [Populus tomentosa]